MDIELSHMACTSQEHVCTHHATKATVTVTFIHFQEVGNKMPPPTQASSKQIPIYIHVGFKERRVKISCCSKVGKNQSFLQNLILKEKF